MAQQNWGWPTSPSKMKLLCAKKHCVLGSLSVLQRRAGAGRGCGRLVFQVGTAQGEQLTQAQAGILQEYQGTQPDLTNVLSAGALPNHPSSGSLLWFPGFLQLS